MAPFLADKNISQQGFLSSEPFAIMQAGVNPVVHLFADAGFDNYQTTINISRKMVDEKKDVVQRFVTASLEGWAEYMKGGPAIEAANAMIKKDNPDMDDEKIAYALKVMNEKGIVRSGDALKLGIGAMTDERWKRFYDTMADAGVFPKGIDVRRPTASNSSTRASVRERRHWRPGAETRRTARRPLVSIRDVSKQFANGTLAIRGVDLDLQAGEFVSLLGPVGLRQVDAAAHHRRARGAERRQRGLADLRAQRASGEAEPDLGFVFQDPTLMPWANAVRNVMLPLTLARRAEGGGRGARRRDARRWSGSRASSTPIRASSPAA